MSSTIQSIALPTIPPVAAPSRIAVVGCGYWGMNYVRIFNEVLDPRLVAICDGRSERLREAGSRFPGVDLTTDVEDVAAHPDVDAAVVCTEATTHYNVTRRLLSAGKHVLVEKPLTTTTADAQELIALAKLKSAVLMVGHTFVFNAGIQKVREYVQIGQGRVYYFYLRMSNLAPIRRDVNALWDLAPPAFAIFTYLLDTVPEWVTPVAGTVRRNS